MDLGAAPEAVEKKKFLCHRSVSNPIPLSPCLQPRWFRSDCMLGEIRVALPPLSRHPPTSFVTKRIWDAKLLQTIPQRCGQKPTKATYFNQHFALLATSRNCHIEIAKQMWKQSSKKTDNLTTLFQTYRAVLRPTETIWRNRSQCLQGPRAHGGFEH